MSAINADDYAAAGLPMLPVVRGAAVASRYSLAYAWATTATLALFVVLTASIAVAVITLPTAAWWLRRCHRLVADPTVAAAGAAFRSSIVFLAVAFLAAPLALA